MTIGCHPPKNATGNLLPGIFLHFLDFYHYYIATRLAGFAPKDVQDELRLALRLSFLLADHVYIPASAYFENSAARLALKEHAELFEAGDIQLCGQEMTLPEHLEKKRKRHYDERSPGELHRAYKRREIPRIPYRSADIRTGETIRCEWTRVVEAGVLPDVLSQSSLRSFGKDPEKIWMKIPAILEGRAFVLGHVLSGFRELGVIPPSEMRLLKILDPSFTISHTRSLNCGVVGDLVYLQPPWPIDGEIGLYFRSVKHKLMYHNLLSWVMVSKSKFLLRVKRSPSWNEFAPSLLNKAPIERQDEDVADDLRRFLLAGEVGCSRRRNRNMPSIGIVTALPEEWLAVTKCLNATAVGSIEGDPNRYASAKVVGKDGSCRVIITFLPRVANNSAAAVSTNLLRSFPDVEDVVFAGIACGCPNPNIPEKHVRLGDVVISDERGVVQLDHRSVTAESIRNRSNMPPPSRRLLNAVRLLQADQLGMSFPWERYLQTLIDSNAAFARPGSDSDKLCDDDGMLIGHPLDPHRREATPKIIHGVIGSGNELLRNAKLRRAYADEFNLRAIEMEGAGTAEAAWHFGKQYLLIRGVCDYGDHLKGDLWHCYAAAAAAAYTKALLCRLVSDKNAL